MEKLRKYKKCIIEMVCPFCKGNGKRKNTDYSQEYKCPYCSKGKYKKEITNIITVEVI